MSSARRLPKVVIYKARDGWRWHLRASNGRIVAESGEAYTNKNGADRAYLRVEEITFWQPDIEMRDA